MASVEPAVAESPQEVATRLAAVRSRMAAAARRAGRDPGAVTLVGVSKTVPAERIRPLLDAGLADLGENRVQEAETKAPVLPADVRWHLVGHLQGNKVNKALDLFGLIHSMDTVELGRAIGERAARRGQRAAVLLQVNVAERESQSGFPAGGVADAVRALAGVDGLLLEGLMCIGPEVEEPEGTRPAFRRLAALFGDARQTAERAGHPWRHLSMGMSNDYPVAVEEGATLVRVGRALFGERPQPAGTNLHVAERRSIVHGL